MIVGPVTIMGRQSGTVRRIARGGCALFAVLAAATHASPAQSSALRLIRLPDPLAIGFVTDAVQLDATHVALLSIGRDRQLQPSFLYLTIARPQGEELQTIKLPVMAFQNCELVARVSERELLVGAASSAVRVDVDAAGRPHARHVFKLG